MLEVIVVNWPTILAVIGILGTIGGLLASFPGLIDLWNRRADSLKVGQITRKTDPNLVGLDEIQQEEFGPDVADPVGEVRGHIVRSRKGRARDVKDKRPYFLAFVLKYKRSVVGYLTAEYFTHSQTIFLWYLVVDKDRIPAHEVRQKGSLKLLAEMVKAADATGVAWRHIITEVEADPTNLRAARAKLQLFQNAGEELSRRAGRDTVRVFRLPIDYMQPILDLRWLADPEPHEVKEWLLYAPRSLTDRLHLFQAGIYMDRTLATSLLDTLLVKAYGNAFLPSRQYRDYCSGKFESYRSALPDQLKLDDEGDRIDSQVHGSTSQKV